LESLGLDIAILRLANVYGPGDCGRVIALFIDRALSGEPLLIYGVGKILDFVWIEDVGHVFVKAAFASFGGMPVNMGSRHGVTLPDLATRILVWCIRRSITRSSGCGSGKAQRVNRC
jgi:UDP-glucose 4-epimerase